MNQQVPAAQVKTGEQLVLAGRKRLVIHAVHPPHGADVTFHFSGSAQMSCPPTTMVRVERSTRVVNHDAPKIVHSLWSE